MRQQDIVFKYYRESCSGSDCVGYLSLLELLREVLFSCHWLCPSRPTGLIDHLMPSMSQTLTCAIALKQSELFSSPVRCHNVLAHVCLTLNSYYQLSLVSREYDFASSLK